MKKLLFILTAVLGAVLIMTCKHEPFPIPPKPVDTTHIPIDTTHKDTTHKGGCSKDTVYFTNTILPLIISSCASPGCHDATTRQGDITLTTYSGIMGLVRPGNPNSSRIYTILSSSDDKMPPNSSLTSAQKTELYTWILQGAKQNTCTDNTACDSVNVKYSTVIAPLLSNNCTGCHNAGLASGGVTLDNYSGVYTVAKNGQLLGGVTGVLSRMPKYGSPLSACDIGKIRKWVTDGAPNN